MMLLARLIQGMQRRLVPVSAFLHSCYNPILLKVPIGSCISKWTDDYLQNHFKDNTIPVHVSETPFLSLENRNFSCQVLQFDAFLNQLQQSTASRFLYYTSQKQQRKKSSNLEVLELSEDFSLPPDLLMPFEIHSTVLKIASTGLCMWLHYDVCDIFFVVFEGAKGLFFFIRMTLVCCTCLVLHQLWVAVF